MSELKPCPFCGNKVEMHQKGTNQITIQCSCGIRLTQKVIRYSLRWLREKMIERWNNQSSLASAIEALETIQSAPGGGPAKRIATLAISKIKGEQ